MYKIINYFNLYYYNAARSVVFPKWSDTYGDYYINTMYCRIGCVALVKTICINDKLKSCDSSITIINGGRLSVISDDITYKRCMYAFIWIFSKLHKVETIAVLGCGKIGGLIIRYLKSINKNVLFLDTRVTKNIAVDLVVSCTNLLSPMHVNIVSRFAISFDGGFSLDCMQYSNLFTEYPLQLHNNIKSEFPLSLSATFSKIPTEVPENSFIYLYGYALFDLLTYLHENSNT